MIKTINIEYERKTYYNDGNEPEFTEIFGDDYYEWDTEIQGELTLENFLLYLEENEDILSYSEDDAIDFDRAEYLDETVLEIQLVNFLENEDDDGEIIEEEHVYYKEEIDAAYDKLYESGLL